MTGNFCPYEVVLITIDKQPHVFSYILTQKNLEVSAWTVAYIQLSYFRFCMPIIWLNHITAKDTHENYQTAFFLDVGGDALLPEKSHGCFHVLYVSVFLKCIPNLAWCERKENKIVFFCMGWRSLSITSPHDVERLNSLSENSVPIAYAIGSLQIANGKFSANTIGEKRLV